MINQQLSDVLGGSNATVTLQRHVGSAQTTAAPSISPDGGSFAGNVTVTLSDVTAGAAIYYTLDGSIPTTPGDSLPNPATSQYTAPLSIATNVTLNAIAYANATDSVVSSASFTVIAGATGINLSSGFSTAASLLTLNGTSTVTGSTLELINGSSYQAASAFYNTALPVQSFSTDFNFQIVNPVADGLAFVIQNVGPTALGSAGEGLGYGPDIFTGQTAIINNSVAIKFDLTEDAGEGYNSTGLYVNGALPTVPAVDLTGSGINLHSGDPMSVHITYDGTTLTMTITDSLTNAHFTYSWPIAIATTIGSNTAYVGFTGASGQFSSVQDITSWSYASTFGLGQAVAPAISLPGGTYATAQTVSLSDATPGATIFYTVDGSTPSASSTAYNPATPITISANTTLKAIAIAPGLIDSPLATAQYVIASGLRFVSITPCRIADTRDPAGPFGGPIMAGASTRNFDIPLQTLCGIPTTAAAYSLNVTAVPTKTLGYLSIWPEGQTQPVVSTLNSDGRIKANAAIVGAGANGGVSVYVSDPSQVILDITGYFVPATTANSLTYYPVAPCRLVDTRNPAGVLGGPSMTAGQSRSFPVAQSCNLPSNAGAYSLNYTAIPHKKLGYLTTWPTGQNQPYVSTLNALGGEITANAAIVAAGTGGAISAYVTDDADLVIDINGYFASTGNSGLSFYANTPCRVLDTRSSTTIPTFVNQVTVPFVNSSCQVPADAKAYVTNATVVPPAKGKLGFLALWPDTLSQPLVSTLNAFDGATTSNMAIIPDLNGSIDAFATDQTDLILDISGYFAP